MILSTAMTRDLGLRLAREGFVDCRYDDDGNLASRSIAASVLTDAEAIAQTLRMVGDGEVISVDGKRVTVTVDSCARMARNRRA
jgi:UPF0271 protein